MKANIAEGWGKKIYIEVFKRHLVDSMGSKDETISWIESAYECKYITIEEFQSLTKEYELLGGKLYTLWKTWR